MSALYDMKAFYRFLEDATIEELKSKKSALLDFIDEAKDHSTHADACYLLKKIEEEMLSRISSDNR